jgi:hypothetical protein
MCFSHSAERVREKIGKGRSGLWAISGIFKKILCAHFYCIDLRKNAIYDLI